MGSLCMARRSASRATGSATPDSSNITRPGLTLATHHSGEPLPEPIRGPAGRGGAAGGPVAAVGPLGAPRALRPGRPVTARAARPQGCRGRLALGPGRRRLAPVDPDLHANPAERGPGLVEAVVDVGAQR